MTWTTRKLYIDKDTAEVLNVKLIQKKIYEIINTETIYQKIHDTHTERIIICQCRKPKQLTLGL